MKVGYSFALGVLLLFTAFSVEAAPASSSNRISVNKTSTTASKYLFEPQKLTQGFRIGVVKSMSDVAMNAKFAGRSFRSTEDSEHKLGVQWGFSRTEFQNFGFMGLLTFNQYNSENRTLRIEGNVNYGLTPQLHGYAGAHVNHFVTIEAENAVDRVDMSPGLGFQFGAGLQISPRYGFGLAYFVSRNKGNLHFDPARTGITEPLELETEIKGLEFNLYALF